VSRERLCVRQIRGRCGEGHWGADGLEEKKGEAEK